MTTAKTASIALVGLMGAGKSAVARVLGERLGASVADLDAMLEAEEGRSIADLFAHEGEPYFRRREGELLRATVASGARVVACGGGAVIDPANRTWLRERCFTVWLDVSPQEAARRLAGQTASRPLLAGEPLTRLTALHAARAPLYEEAARVRVDTGGRSVEAVADAVLAAWRAAAA